VLVRLKVVPLYPLFLRVDEDKALARRVLADRLIHDAML
jgi:hypothetical protein